MNGSIHKRWSSHEDAIYDVDPLSSKDLVVVVDFTGSQIATLRRSLTWTNVETWAGDLRHRQREGCSSHRQQFLSKPGSVRYFSTPPLTTLLSDLSHFIDYVVHSPICCSVRKLKFILVRLTYTVFILFNYYLYYLLFIHYLYQSYRVT